MSDRWPITLTGSTPGGLELALRPLRRSDRDELLDLRARNQAWLKPNDPTSPPGAPPRPDLAKTFGSYRRGLERSARQGSAVPLLITTGGRIIGQITASSIVLGAARSAAIGYWVSADHAGRWVAPTATAMLSDWLLDPAGWALHRIELTVRPDNEASLAVVRKLGFRAEGERLAFLHIDGQWRDHLAFAVVTEELGPGGLQTRLTHAYQESRPRHTA